MCVFIYHGEHKIDLMSKNVGMKKKQRVGELRRINLGKFSLETTVHRKEPKIFLFPNQSYLYLQLQYIIFWILGKARKIAHNKKEKKNKNIKIPESLLRNPTDWIRK